MKAIAVTFDFGQTLADLDTAMLSRRAAERGVTVDANAIAASVPIAWAEYDAAIRKGFGGHPWKFLMRTLLAESQVAPADAASLTDWLWDEQPKQNLWRLPIPGMFELARELHRKHVTIGVISNSEGKLAELVRELGLDDALTMIVDSGVFGVTKPDPRIFLFATDQLGVEPADVIHIGDSYEADVKGALNVGMRAIWFRGKQDEPRVRATHDAASTRAALIDLGVAI
jgi:HAD superfamily hydrolase (TIGR01549 family)